MGEAVSDIRRLRASARRSFTDTAGWLGGIPACSGGRQTWVLSKRVHMLAPRIGFTTGCAVRWGCIRLRSQAFAPLVVLRRPPGVGEGLHPRCRIQDAGKARCCWAEGSGIHWARVVYSCLVQFVEVFTAG